MKTATVVLAFLTCIASQLHAQSPDPVMGTLIFADSDCSLAEKYKEITARSVSNADDYAALERDFISLNGMHAKPLRLPPSLRIPLTPDNLSAKADDLKKIAQARRDMLLAAGCK